MEFQMSENSQNPLAKHFRQPILYLKLPSNGRWYPEGSVELPVTGEIPVYAMTARDEITLKTPDALMNGTSTVAEVNTKKVQVHTAAQSGISEISITANASLGDGTYTSNGIRSSWFKSNIAFNPPYSSGLNYFTGNVYSESSDPGVAGTRESTIRWGIIKHDLSDFGNTYLPAGPNRSSDSGVQFFTFAFQRRVVSQFSLNIVAPSGVANVWIAAPGTTLDSTSSLNGWLRCDTTYAGSGKPGAVVANGGNGSDGVAFTSGDKITANTALNGTFKMTLGTESLTNATNNVCLVRIALVSGQTVTTLAVS